MPEPARAARQRRPRASAVERRQAILQAVITIIARDGIRAVRHRAVATEAGVPLSATTYYFNDIGQLLTEAFAHFNGQKDSVVAGFQQEMGERLAQMPPLDSLSPVQRDDFASHLADRLTEYVCEQASDQDGRVVELAFRHEAQRNPAMATLVNRKEQEYLTSIATNMEKLGVEDPFSDAEIMLALILRLESNLIFGHTSVERVRNVFRCQFRRMLQG